jgi:DNA-binding GntR family transcriptional regulator
MKLVRVDTQRAYELIREKITTLELGPGAAINEQRLAEDLDMGLVPVREALKLLAHDDLVIITPRHGLYVAALDVPDLERISEMRLSLESLCARLAARRATPDDLVVLEALSQEQSSISPEDSQGLFDFDHRFHQAIAQAAHNKYLARTLDHLFGLSQRLWYLALPHIEFLPGAVEKHLDLVRAIKAGNAEQAEQIMSSHVQNFYDKVREVLAAEEQTGSPPHHPG